MCGNNDISIASLQNLIKNFEFDYALDIWLDLITFEMFYILRRRSLTLMWFLFFPFFFWIVIFVDFFNKFFWCFWLYRRYNWIWKSFFKLKIIIFKFYILFNDTQKVINNFYKKINIFATFWILVKNCIVFILVPKKIIYILHLWLFL